MELVWREHAENVYVMVVHDLALLMRAFIQ